MSLIMSLIMSSKVSSKLYTDEEIGFERIIEIRIRNLKKNKQKSFSLFTKKEIKNYPSIEIIKKFLEEKLKDL